MFQSQSRCGSMAGYILIAVLVFIYLVVGLFLFGRSDKAAEEPTPEPQVQVQNPAN